MEKVANYNVGVPCGECDATAKMSSMGSIFPVARQWQNAGILTSMRLGQVRPAVGASDDSERFIGRFKRFICQLNKVKTVSNVHYVIDRDLLSLPSIHTHTHTHVYIYIYIYIMLAVHLYDYLSNY